VPLESWISSLIEAIKTRHRGNGSPDEDGPDSSA